VTVLEQFRKIGGGGPTAAGIFVRLHRALLFDSDDGIIIRSFRCRGFRDWRLPSPNAGKARRFHACLLA
jgi:hypothetical protein